MSDPTYAQEQEQADQMLDAQIEDYMHQRYLKKQRGYIEEPCGICYSRIEHENRRYCESLAVDAT